MFSSICYIQFTLFNLKFRIELEKMKKGQGANFQLRPHQYDNEHLGNKFDCPPNIIFYVQETHSKIYCIIKMMTINCLNNKQLLGLLLFELIIELYYINILVLPH